MTDLLPEKSETARVIIPTRIIPSAGTDGPIAVDRTPGPEPEAEQAPRVRTVRPGPLPFWGPDGPQPPSSAQPPAAPPAEPTTVPEAEPEQPAKPEPAGDQPAPAVEPGSTGAKYKGGTVLATDKQPAPAGVAEILRPTPAKALRGWHPARVRWAAMWVLPGVVGACVGWTGYTRTALDWFSGNGARTVLDLVPVAIAAVLAWKSRRWYLPVAWIARIPLGTAVLANLLYSSSSSPENHMLTLAAPPTTDLGGTGLGAITVGGLAALATFVMWLLLKGPKGKNSGLNPEVDKKLSWEFLAAAGFITGNLYAAAGWNAVALLITSVTKSAAAAWGSGIVALGITAWIGLRKHGRWGASFLGLSAAVLYNTAGGWWSFGSIGVVKLVETVQEMS